MAAILAPESEDVLFSEGETVSLAGAGYDFEDGVLTAEQLSWFSDVDGELGAGTTLQVTGLTPGMHAITLVATDSDGQTGQTELEIEVVEEGIAVDTQEIEGPGIYPFGDTGVEIEVESTGGCLDVISVRRIPENHPQAIAGLDTGEYWTISQTGCAEDGSDQFFVNLTLPATDTPSVLHQLCRYTGTDWDCAADSFDVEAGAVTRNSVTRLSDWVVGQPQAGAYIYLPVVLK
jgi:hypothetical protein